MAITRDGLSEVFGFSGGTSTGAITHAVGGSAQSNALMLAVIAVTAPNATPINVSGITDSQGNTWHKYTGLSAGSGWHTADTVNGVQRGFSLEVWYTKAATINSSINVTVGFDNTIDSAVVSLSGKFLGYDPTNPFDGNASLPKKLTINSGAAAETLSGISTTNAHVMGCWAFGAWGTSIAHSNPTYNSVAQDDMVALQHNNSEFVKGQYGNGTPITGTYSGVSFASPTSADNAFIIGFALTADPAPPARPPLKRAFIVG